MSYNFIDNLFIKKYYTEPSASYNIVSTVIFRIEDNYKPMCEYYTKLENFVENFHDLFNEFYFRIYFDSSIIKYSDNEIINNEITTIWRPLLIKLKKKSFIQLCYYKHKHFMKNKIYHVGLFGTIIRFIPIFDYSFNKNINIIIISDVDVNHKYLTYTKKSLDYTINNNLRFFFRTSFCKYASGYHVATINLVNTWLRVMAGTVIIYNYKFPNLILNNFFNQIYKQKFDSHFNKFINITTYNIHSHKTKTELIFKYGIDEFFAMYLLKHIIENKIKFGYISQKDIDSSIFFWVKKNNMLENDSVVYQDVLQHLLKKHYKQDNNCYLNYKFYENQMYVYHTFNKPSDLQLELAHNTFDFFTKIKKNNLYNYYGFDKFEVDCIIKQKDLFQYKINNNNIDDDFYTIDYTNISSINLDL